MVTGCPVIGGSRHPVPTSSHLLPRSKILGSMSFQVARDSSNKFSIPGKYQCRTDPYLGCVSSLFNCIFGTTNCCPCGCVARNSIQESSESSRPCFHCQPVSLDDFQVHWKTNILSNRRISKRSIFLWRSASFPSCLISLKTSCFHMDLFPRTYSCCTPALE